MCSKTRPTVDVSLLTASTIKAAKFLYVNAWLEEKLFLFYICCPCNENDSYPVATVMVHRQRKLMMTFLRMLMSLKTETSHTFSV